MARYTVFLTPEPDEGGYSVRVPTLPGLSTQGDSYTEAVENAIAAIAFHLQSLREEGAVIPEEAPGLRIAVVDV
jgi:antitoxin HicB